MVDYVSSTTPSKSASVFQDDNTKLHLTAAAAAVNTEADDGEVPAASQQPQHVRALVEAIHVGASKFKLCLVITLCQRIH